MTLFVTDLDGTLLNEHHVLDETTRQYIKELRSQGHIFGVATGRPFESALKAIPDMEAIFDFGVFNNGANFIDFKDQEQHDQYPLSDKTIKHIIDLYSPMGANPILFVGDTMYTHNRDPYHDRLLKTGYTIEFGDFNQILEPSHEKIIFSVNSDTRKRILDYTKNNPSEDYVAFMSQAELVEFMDPRINKWIGVEYFINKYELHHLTSVTFGDNENDLQLIEGAHLGVAMENAILKLKHASDAIAPAHDQLGVYTFIQDYLQKQ